MPVESSRAGSSRAGSSRATSSGAVGPLLLALLAWVVQLVVGYFYLVGGLVIPGPVLIPLWILWLALSAVLVRLTLLRSWWTPVVPILAAAVLVLTLVVGGQLLGWQA
jgi:hypothetical protein